MPKLNAAGEPIDPAATSAEDASASSSSSAKPVTLKTLMAQRLLEGTAAADESDGEEGEDAEPPKFVTAEKKAQDDARRAFLESVESAERETKSDKKEKKEKAQAEAEDEAEEEDMFVVKQATEEQKQKCVDLSFVFYLSSRRLHVVEVLCLQ